MNGITSIRRNDLIVCCLLLLFALQSFAAIRSTSATFDEGQIYGVGKYLLIKHRWDLMGCIMQPPLPYYVSSLPLFFAQEDPRIWEYVQQDRDLKFLAAVDVYRAQELLSAPGNAGDRLLIASRLTILVFGLLLGYFVYRFSRELHGEAGGLISLFLFAFCPNMIAYSGLILSDMPFCALAFISCYYFRHFLLENTPKSAVIAGIVTGLALTTKLNAILLIPFFLLIFLVHHFCVKRGSTTRMMLIIGLAILVLFFCYGFNITPYLQGFQYRMLQLDTGFKAFFHGSYSIDGWWYYYPVLFLTKSPLPVLITTFAGVCCYLARGREKWFDTVCLLFPAILLMLLFSTSKIAAGIRYILPVYPFLFVMAGILVQYRDKIDKALYLLAFWYVGMTLFIAPHYLSYFNEVLGGPDQAYRYFVDSNLDWGQDLKGLKKYMDKHGISKISLSYFGIDSPKRYGIDYDWLPSFYLINPTPDNIATVPENRFVAISATNLQGVFLEPADTFAWFRQFEPVAKIGHSIFIYDLTLLPPVGH
jgi:4-amino-4-deoxy-L-arabinose transferase-like glycosyltransferase